MLGAATRVLHRLLILPLIALAMGVTSAPAAPAMWKVSDGDSHIWLFGSIHVLKKEHDWRTPAFDAALLSSEQVYFEVVLDAINSAKLLRLTMIYGYYRDGGSLADALTDLQFDTLVAFLESNGLDVPTYLRMRPWYALITLGQALAEPGTVPLVPIGVETIVAMEVDDAKERALETTETQFRLLSAGSDAEQIAALMEAIAYEGEITVDDVLDELTSAWLSGDTERLHQQMVASLGPPESPLYRRFLSDRNRRWADQLGEVLANNDEAMVIVGAGHMVGPEGLPTLLAERGFTVERLPEPRRIIAPRRQN